MESGSKSFHDFLFLTYRKFVSLENPEEPLRSLVFACGKYWASFRRYRGKWGFHFRFAELRFTDRVVTRCIKPRILELHQPGLRRSKIRNSYDKRRLQHSGLRSNGKYITRKTTFQPSKPARKVTLKASSNLTDNGEAHIWVGSDLGNVRSSLREVERELCKFPGIPVVIMEPGNWVKKPVYKFKRKYENLDR